MPSLAKLAEYEMKGGKKDYSESLGQNGKWAKLVGSNSSDRHLLPNPS